jgi:hypothetical protein
MLDSYLSTEADKQKVWGQFLKENGLTTAPPTDTATLQKFNAFVSNAYNSLAVNENVATPQEMTRRRIMFDAYSIVLKMIDAIQDSVRTLSKSLLYYGKWQQEYTRLMSNIPLYSPDNQSKFVYDAQDIGKSRLGYGDFDLRTALEYSVKAIIKNNTAAPEIYIGTNPNDGGGTSNTDPTGRFRMITVSTTPNMLNPTKRDVLVSLYDHSPGAILPPGKLTLLVSAGLLDPLNGNETEADIPRIADLIIQRIQGFPTFRTDIAAMNGRPSVMQWRGLTPPPSGATAQQILDHNSLNQRLRGEYNAKLQVYLENARAQRTIVRDMQKPIESALSQAREAVTQMVNLLTSITETMKGLLSAIHR